MGFTTTFLDGAGKFLHAENVGAYKPVGNYLPDDVAITFDLFHSTVNKAIAVTAYKVGDWLDTTAVIGLQLWIRGAPNNRASAKDILDRAVDALHGLRDTTWNDIPIVLVEHQSQTSHGLDANKREEISCNFYVTLTRTGTHRRD